MWHGGFDRCCGGIGVDDRNYVGKGEVNNGWELCSLTKGAGLIYLYTYGDTIDARIYRMRRSGMRMEFQHWSACDISRSTALPLVAGNVSACFDAELPFICMSSYRSCCMSSSSNLDEFFDVSLAWMRTIRE